MNDSRVRPSAKLSRWHRLREYGAARRRELALFHVIWGLCVVCVGLYLVPVFMSVLTEARELSQFLDGHVYVTKQRVNSDIDQMLERKNFLVTVTLWLGITTIIIIGYGLINMICGRIIRRDEGRLIPYVLCCTNLLLIPFGTFLAVWTACVLSEAPREPGVCRQKNPGSLA